MISKVRNIPVGAEQEKYVRAMRARVFDHMLKTRGWKYRSFLRYLRFFKYIAFAPVRGEFLESYYTLMRYLDDLVDGDTVLPQEYSDESDYMMEKIRFAMNPVNPKDEVDFLMQYCFELAVRFDENFETETKDILDSLLFDAKRRGKLIIFPKAELMHHFHVLDVRGTIRATLKVFKDDPDKYTVLEPLGIACRHQYNIEDIETDIAAGYVNIPAEECLQFGITKDDLLQSSSVKIKSWLRQHAKDGLALLDKHHQVMPQKKFSVLQKAVFKVVYEMPARKTFMKTLADIKP